MNGVSSTGFASGVQPGDRGDASGSPRDARILDAMDSLSRFAVQTESLGISDLVCALASAQLALFQAYSDAVRERRDAREREFGRKASHGEAAEAGTESPQEVDAD